MKTKGKTIAFLGDSITQGVGASSIDTAWATLVANDGEFASGYNYGISGTRIARQRVEFRQDFNEHFIERAKRMPENLDYILVFGGSNDYGHGDAPMGKLGDTTDETFYGGMEVLLTYLLTSYPTAKIAVMTPIHRENETRLYNEQNQRNVGTLLDYVNAEREVCQKYGVPVLDLYAVSGICPDNAANKAAYTTDGLHPNDRGHRLIADKVLSYLENVL